MATHFVFVASTLLLKGLKDCDLGIVRFTDFKSLKVPISLKIPISVKVPIRPDFHSKYMLDFSY